MCQKHFPVSKGKLGASKNANEAFESIDHVPLTIPNSSHPTQLYMYNVTAAVIPMINEGRSPSLRHLTRTHTVDLDWLLERVCVQLAGILTKGMFITMHWHSFLTLWQFRQLFESNDVRSFFSQTFLSFSFTKAQNSVSGDDAKRVC